MSAPAEGLIIRTAQERSLQFEIGHSRAESHVIYTHPPDAAEDGVKQLYDLAIEHMLAARDRLPEEVVYDHTEVTRVNGIIAVTGRLVALRQDQLDHPGDYPLNIDYSFLLTRFVIFGDRQHNLVSALRNEAHLEMPYREITRYRNRALRKLASLDRNAYHEMLDTLAVGPKSRKYPKIVIAAMRKPFEAHQTRVVSAQSETLYI